MEDNCLNIANDVLSVLVPWLNFNCTTIVVRLKQTEQSSIKQKHPLQPQKSLNTWDGWVTGSERSRAKRGDRFSQTLLMCCGST